MGEGYELQHFQGDHREKEEGWGFRKVMLQVKMWVRGLYLFCMAILHLNNLCFIRINAFHEFGLISQQYSVLFEQHYLDITFYETI